MNRHKSSKPDTESALVHAEACRLGYLTFPPFPQKLSLFLTLEELRRWRSGGWREESFVVEQENKVMLVILQNQSYMSYHEKISTKQIPTCEKTVKEDNQDTPAVRICINMQQKYGRMHQVNKNCLKVMRHHYNWSMNLHWVLFICLLLL